MFTTSTLLAAAFLVTDPTETKFDAKAELAKLEGVWQTDTAAKVSVRLEVKGRGLSLKANGPGITLEVSHLTGEAFEVKDMAGRRMLRIDEVLAKLSDVPRDVGYRFDKDALVLVFDAGDLKGEHRLTKAAK